MLRINSKAENVPGEGHALGVHSALLHLLQHLCGQVHLEASGKGPHLRFKQTNLLQTHDVEASIRDITLIQVHLNDFKCIFKSI